MSADLREIQLVKASDLSAVLVEPDGVLKASAIAAVRCADGTVGLLGLDANGAEFVRAPLSTEGVRWLIGQLNSLIREPIE